MLKLVLTSESQLDDVKINEVFSDEFFESNFWLYWSTMFAFEPWASAMEMRRYLLRFVQHVGTLNGNVNVGANVSVAATFTVTTPPNLNQQHLYISQRSTLPFYAAYRISSGGVSYASTIYRPVSTFTNATTLRVQLIAQRNVSGSNSAQSYSGFFENVIYCPFESDIYTGYGE